MDSDMRTRTASRAAQIAVAMAAVALLLVGSARPAAAKGPYPATLSGPGIDQPIDLMQTADPALVSQLIPETGLYAFIYEGAGDAAGEALGARPASSDLGPMYTLTWLTPEFGGHSEDERTIHQYIYAHARLGLAIHTPDQDGLGLWGVGAIGWFVAPIGLQQTLTELGIEIQRRHEPTSVVGGEVSGPPSTQAVAGASSPSLLPSLKDSASPQNTRSTLAIRLGVLGVIAASVALAGTIGARLVRRTAPTNL